MTNRERLSKMSVVDFFDKYNREDKQTFDDFVAESMLCELCPVTNCDSAGNCETLISLWLDKEE